MTHPFQDTEVGSASAGVTQEVDTGVFFLFSLSRYSCITCGEIKESQMKFKKISINFGHHLRKRRDTRETSGRDTGGGLLQRVFLSQGFI